jgi:uncharacterized protein YndB with AHSA1/START domain
MTTQQHVTVRVTRRFIASAERVFDAWLDPAMIGRWMFGPNVRDEEIVRLTLDARVGGTFSFVVRRQGDEIDHVGEYLEIDRPSRLAFTWGVKGDSTDFSRVVIAIQRRERGADLTLTHELHPDWADYAARTEAGWTTMLNTLARTLG